MRMKEAKAIEKRNIETHTKLGILIKFDNLHVHVQ